MIDKHVFMTGATTDAKVVGPLLLDLCICSINMSGNIVCCLKCR